MIKILYWYGYLSERLSTARWRVGNRADTAVNAWFILGSCLDTVILIWHGKLLKTPAEDTFKKIFACERSLTVKSKYIGFITPLRNRSQWLVTNEHDKRVLTFSQNIAIV